MSKNSMNKRAFRLIHEIFTLLRGGFPGSPSTRKSLMKLGRLTIGLGIVFRLLKYGVRAGKPRVRFRHELAEGQGLLITHKKANR